MNPYQQLAKALDALPNGFSPTPDGRVGYCQCGCQFGLRKDANFKTGA